MEEFCEITLDRERLRSEVRNTYTQVAKAPTGDFHFHRGPEYAARLLGYDSAELAALPGSATASFAGVGNPFRVREIPAGAVVVDLGSGAGMDCLLAGRRVGAQGRVVGVDMTDAMLDLARKSATEAGMPQVSFAFGEITDLPVDDESVDVVISNGVINLAVDKHEVFRDIYRVLKPGGWIQFADIVIDQDLSEKARNDIDLWVG
ncbi:MAG: methyltransferase domain-containing protein [Betaproteobacteria bacterium]|nr:methyltransferase domain-containing protein [Betaproteobacteria bacterium]